MKNPHFISRPDRSCDTGTEPTKELLDSTGGNTGNLLFISTLRRVVSHQTYSCSVGFRPKQVAEAHDGLVIPAANWLNQTSDWGRLSELIEASRLPCVMVGLGAQAPSTDSYPKITKGTERLLRVVSERCRSISVRGEYSAEVLDRYGISNVAVTGCPSLLYEPPRHFAKKRPPAEGITKISVSSSRGKNLATLGPRTVRGQLGLILSRQARAEDYDYVAQTELFDIQIARSAPCDEDSRPEALTYLMRVYGSADERAVVSYVRRKVKTFFNVPDWLSYLGARDLFVSTRLHGVIASLLAGTPAALIVHDTRTAEMARWASIPSIPAQDVLDAGGIDPAAISEGLDLGAFNARMPSYRESFKAFFKENAVSTTIGD